MEWDYIKFGSCKKVGTNKSFIGRNILSWTGLDWQVLALVDDSGWNDDDAHVGLVLGQPLVPIAPGSLQAVVRGGVKWLIGVQVSTLIEKLYSDLSKGLLDFKTYTAWCLEPESAVKGYWVS